MANGIPEGLDAFVAPTPTPTSEAQPQGALASTPMPPGLDDFTQEEITQQKYGTLGQQTIAGAEALGKGVAGPLATGAEKLLGVPSEDILGRQAANPVTHVGGEIAGLVGSTVAGVGLGSALGKIGGLGAKAAEAIGAGTVGTNIARHAIENLVFQAGDETSKLILNDPNQSVHTAMVDMGLASLIGGGFGTLNPLWQATKGRMTGGVLHAIADKLGGIEGVAKTPVDDAIAKSGIEVPAEVKALAAENPELQNMARELMQTDSNASGRHIQEAYKNVTDQAGDMLVKALGKSPEEISAMPEISKYDAGKHIGETLAKEYEANLNPFSNAFEEVKGKLKDVELPLDTVTETGRKIPGAMTKAAGDIAKLAIDEGWASSPSSDIMREVMRVQKELPLQKNIKQLSQFISQVGNNTNKDLLNGPMRNAGGKMISALKEVEAEAISEKLGQEAPQLLETFKAAREGYAVQSAMKEALDSRLGLKGSTGGFANALREMARTDGEGVLRRLSGKNDAELLNFLSSHYPETASALRNFHISSLLENAANKAKEGATINNTAFLQNFSKLSPELKSFISSADSQDRIKAVSAVLDALKNPKHNFSNTARVLGPKLEKLAGTAVGLASALMGHGVAGVIIAPIANALGKDAPDAIKLALLKWLGSSKNVDPGAFKHMVDFMNHAVRGENTLTKATKNIFKAGSEVVPASLFPKDTDRAKINKAVEKYSQNPDALFNGEVAGKTAHYMPDHATELGQTAATALRHIYNQRPDNGKAAPLDVKKQPSPDEIARYNRTLDIAQQPLMVLQHIANGQLQPSDVMTQKMLYPGLYNRTVQKLTDQVAKASANGVKIPYRTRMGLSMYMGQALDSTMTPQAILAAQPKPQNGQQQPQQAPSGKMTQKGGSALNKMSKMYQTTGQNAERDRSTRE